MKIDARDSLLVELFRHLIVLSLSFLAGFPPLACLTDPCASGDVIFLTSLTPSCLSSCVGFRRIMLTKRVRRQPLPYPTRTSCLPACAHIMSAIRPRSRTLGVTSHNSACWGMMLMAVTLSWCSPESLRCPFSLFGVVAAAGFPPACGERLRSWTSAACCGCSDAYFDGCDYIQGTAELDDNIESRECGIRPRSQADFGKTTSVQ